MKKVLVLLLVLSLVGLTACESNNAAANFKNDYEEINGKENASGKIHRSVIIDDNNNFIEVTAEEIVKKIENEETFYVYFGSRLCPWCRSTIEMADKVSRDNGIEKVYYVDIWDDDGNEILRDKYSLNAEGKLEVTFEGTEAYKKLIAVFGDLLSEYTLTDSNGNKVIVGEKRIFAPNYIYIQNGKAVRITTGISDKQSDSREELTSEMLDDEKEQFDNFFLNYCDELC